MRVSSLVGSIEGLDVYDDMRNEGLATLLWFWEYPLTIIQRFLRIVQYLPSDVGAFQAAVPVYT